MKLTQKEVEHVAKLARLDLTTTEKKKFTQQLSSILTYIDELKKVGADDVDPTYQVTGLLDVTRDDKVEDCDEETQKQIMKNIPTKDGNYIKVKGVFEEGNNV